MTLAERLERANKNPDYFARFFPYGCGITAFGVIAIVSLRDALGWVCLAFGLATVVVSLHGERRAVRLGHEDAVLAAFTGQPGWLSLLDVACKTGLTSRDLTAALDRLEASARIELRLVYAPGRDGGVRWTYRVPEPGDCRRRFLRSVRREHLILRVLACHPGGMYGLDLWKLTRVAPGSLYPCLVRLEARGLVRAWWGEPPADGGPRRRFYGLAEPDGGAPCP